MLLEARAKMNAIIQKLLNVKHDPYCSLETALACTLNKNVL